MKLNGVTDEWQYLLMCLASGNNVFFYDAIVARGLIDVFEADATEFVKTTDWKCSGLA